MVLRTSNTRYKAFLVTQMVKNLHAMWETWVWSLSWKDPLEKEMATHSSILPGEFQGQRSLAGYCPCGRKESDRKYFQGPLEKLCGRILYWFLMKINLQALLFWIQRHLGIPQKLHYLLIILFRFSRKTTLLSLK